MLRRFAIASLLTVASAAGFSSASFAADGDVIFDGNAAPVCTVATEPGVPLDVTETDGFTTLFEGETELDARCNTSADISAASIDDNSSTTLSNVEATPGTAYQVPFSTMNQTTGAFLVPVSLTASNDGGIIPAGDYSYTVTVSITPQ